MTRAADDLTQSDRAHVPIAPFEGIQTLLDASGLVLGGSSVEQVLAGVVDLAQHLIAADAYAVWRTYDRHSWNLVTSRGLSPSYRTEIKSDYGNPPAVLAIADVDADSRVQQYAPAYRAEGIRSMLVVPLQLQDSMPEGPNCATITFYWRVAHVCSRLDISYASALANLSSAALNIAELHEQNLRERTRLAFLAEASALLTSSLDYETTLQRTAELSVAHIADWCTVHIVEKGVPTRIVVAHRDPAMLEFAERYNAQFPEVIREDRGVGHVLRTGATEFHRYVTDEMLSAAVHYPEQLEMLRRVKITSSILVPLSSHGRILGTIRLLAAGGSYYFTDDDVRLAEDLGRRAAAAVESARLHRAVLEQQERLKLAHAAAMIGTWQWDLGRQQIIWSEEFCERYGFTDKNSSTAAEGSRLIHPEDREAVVREIRAALNSDAEYISVEHRAVAGDGRLLWIHSRGRIERDGNGKPISVLGISMDVTERHHSEEALRRSEKLAAAGRLAATVAHEINNPLESIVNLVYLSRIIPNLPEEAALYLSSADKELTRIAHIVRQTLGFYRETIEPRIADIGEIVEETVEVYRQRMNARSIRCRVDLDRGIRARVIPGEIKQVATNLIANAIDATEPAGSIEISVKRDGERIIFIVKDSGSGIQEEHRRMMFEPFFTTKKEIGTGLGLWVTKGIVEKHHGTIEVDSSTDPASHGTAFRITLPLN